MAKKPRSPKLPVAMARYLRRLWEASKTLNHKVDAIKWEVQRTMCAFHTAGWSYGSIANAIGVNPNTVSLHVKECCKMFDRPLNHLIPNVGVVYPVRSNQRGQRVYILTCEDVIHGVFGSRERANIVGKSLFDEAGLTFSVQDFRIMRESRTSG